MNTPHDRSTDHDEPSRTGASSGDPARPSKGASGAGDAVKDAAEQVKSEGKAQADQYRDAAADKIDTLADSVKAAASKLEGDDVGHLSGHIADMADSMSQLSEGLRNKSADQILHDVSRIARENPALFLAGSIAVGFGLTRFARASARDDGAGSGASPGSHRQPANNSNQSNASGSSSQNPSGRHSSATTGSGGQTDTSPSNIPGMASHPATSGGSGGGSGTHSSNTAGPSGATAGSSASGSASGTSYSTGTGTSSVNDASLGTGAGSTMATGRSRDPSGRDAGGGSAAAPGALDPGSAPYNTTPEQSNGRKPS